MASLQASSNIPWECARQVEVVHEKRASTPFSQANFQGFTFHGEPAFAGVLHALEGQLCRPVTAHAWSDLHAVSANHKAAECADKSVRTEERVAVRDIHYREYMY